MAETTQGQQIVTGEPQSPDEINVMDYTGVQAIQPTLTPETKLADKVKDIEIDETQEIQQYTDLAPEAPTVATPVTPAAETVTAPEMPETALATFQEATTVDKPELTETSAVQSYEQISKAADAFSSAQLELADVDPRATVQGQLALLQKHFEGGETPVWAQGAMKQATALMAQRGMGGSTMAAEAITNALMQSTLPIAQQDASFYQEVSMTNLANEQQVEMTKFNARVTSIFNDQAAENTARNINAATANDLAKFYADLSQNVVLTNTAAFNAMEQFNASTTNQAEQFAAELGVAVDTFNADAINDRAEFDAELALNVSQFNASMKNNREQFNVANQIAIDASNVQWRRDVNTANTAATNAATQMDVQNAFTLQGSALNNLWNHYDTVLNMAFKAEESKLDRANNLVIASMTAEMQKQIAEAEADAGLIGGLFEAGSTFVSSASGQDFLKKYNII